MKAHLIASGVVLAFILTLCAISILPTFVLGFILIFVILATIYGVVVYEVRASEALK